MVDEESVPKRELSIWKSVVFCLATAGEVREVFVTERALLCIWLWGASINGEERVCVSVCSEKTTTSQSKCE